MERNIGDWCHMRESRNNGLSIMCTKTNQWNLGTFRSSTIRFNFNSCSLFVKFANVHFLFLLIKIWSGADILKDGQCILECYGGSLDVLNEGDCVGIMRTSEGNIMSDDSKC